MDYDVKLYKSFYVLGLKEIPQHLFQVDGTVEVFLDNENKIIFGKRLIDEDKLELKLMWENKKEIKTEEISDFGEIITNTSTIKEVIQSFIWIYREENNPFIFVFAKKLNQLRDIQHILKKFLEIETLNISLKNNFFNQLLLSNIVYDVQSISFQPIDDLSSYTISGEHITSSELYANFNKDQNNITEMTIKLRNHCRVKIYRNSKIIIYNTPSIYDTFETIDEIKYLLSEGGATLG